MTIPPESGNAPTADDQTGDNQTGDATGDFGDDFADDFGDELADDLDDGLADIQAPLLADEEVPGALEAVLLVVDAPVADETLAATVGRPADEVRRHLESIAARLADAHSGIDLREAGGGWRFYTRDTYAPVVERFVMDGTQTRLSKAALETLAVVAYRQPVTRSRIAAVRGVNVDGVVRTLLARGLISQDGTDPDTGGTLYRTTEMFLERMGLAGIDDLPPLGPLLPDVDAMDDE